MIPSTFGEWLTGGIATTILAVIGLWWKIRSERAENRNEARSVAVEAAEGAVKVVREAMDTQAAQVSRLTQQITDQGGQITDLTTRVTTLDKSHQVALRHIAEREGWAMQRWPEHRPDDLPTVPTLIVADVIAVDPSLRIIQRTDIRPREPATPAPDDDDPDPRIRDPTD